MDDAPEPLHARDTRFEHGDVDQRPATGGMTFDPEDTYRVTVYMLKLMSAIGGITLGCGLALGAVLWGAMQLIRHLFGR